MDAREFDELFDAAGRVLEAAMRNQEAAEHAMRRLEKSTHKFESTSNAVRNDVGLTIRESLDNATTQASDVLVKRLAETYKGVEKAAREFREAGEWARRKAWWTVVTASIVTTAMVCGLAYLLLYQEIRELRSEKINLVSTIKRLHNLDLRSCGELPCVKIDNSIDPYKGVYYTIAED